MNRKPPTKERLAQAGPKRANLKRIAAAMAAAKTALTKLPDSPPLEQKVAHADATELGAVIEQGKGTVTVGETVIGIDVMSRTPAGSEAEYVLMRMNDEADWKTLHEKLLHMNRLFIQQGVSMEIVEGFYEVLNIAVRKRTISGASTDQLLAQMPQAIISAEGRRKAESRHKKSAKGKAMLAIRAEFDRWQKREVRYQNDAHFAKMMQDQHPILSNEGSIQNAVTRWRKELKSSC